jgi:hypothetical protein
MQSHAPPRVRCQCDAVVLIKIGFLCAFLFPFIFIMQSHAPTRVRCQCDAVVLIKMILCAFFLFPFILIMQSHAPYTGKMCQCDGCVN